MKLSRPFNATAADLFNEFDHFFNRALSRPLLAGARQRHGAFGVYEADSAWHLRTDLPGFRKEDLSLRFEEGTLHLKAEREENTRTFPASVERSFRVPDNVDATRIEARLENGVLEIVLPKVEQDQPASRSIEIQ